jgi:membrane protein DedA with SNARE-associated domain
MTEWVTDIVDRLGYVGVAFLVALESLFPPIPSELILPLAGFVAGQGDANFLGMVLAATAGSLVGAWILYGISAAIGPERLHRFVVRYGRWFGVKDTDLVRAEDWFDRRSTYAVLFGRCVPLIRSIVSVPAGFRRMPIVRFTIATVAGSLVWNFALIGGGALLGDRWEELGDYVAVFQWLVIVLIVGAIGWFVWTRLVKPKLTGRKPDGEPVSGADPGQNATAAAGPPDEQVHRPPTVE